MKQAHSQTKHVWLIYVDLWLSIVECFRLLVKPFYHLRGVVISFVQGKWRIRGQTWIHNFYVSVFRKEDICWRYASVAYILPLKIGKPKNETTEDAPDLVFIKTLAIGDPWLQFLCEGAGAVLIKGDELMHDNVVVVVVISPDFVVDEGEKVVVL